MPQQNVFDDGRAATSFVVNILRSCAANHWLLTRRPTSLGTRTVGWDAMLGVALYMPTVALVCGGERSAREEPGQWGVFWLWYFATWSAFWLQLAVSKAKYRGIHNYEIGQTWLLGRGSPWRGQRAAEAAFACATALVALGFSPPLALSVFGAWLLDCLHVTMIQAKIDRGVAEARSAQIEGEVFRRNFERWRG